MTLDLTFGGTRATRLWCLVFAGLTACGGAQAPAEPPASAPSTDDASGAEEPVRDDWVRRKMRARNPQLPAQLADARRRIEADPNDGLAHTDLGWALYHDGQVEQALAELERGAALAPKVFVVQQRLGLAYLRTGREERGVAALEAALALESGHAETHFSLGHGYQRLERLDEALEQFRAASAANPDHVESAYQQALLLMDSEPDTATGLFEKTLSLDGYHAGACTNLARLYRKAGRKEDSARMLERHREIALLSDLGVLADPMGVARFDAEFGFYARQGKRDEAFEALERGLRVHGNSGRLWQRRGELHGQAGEVEEAGAAFATAARLAPEDPRVLRAWMELFEAHPEPGPSEATLEAFRSACERFPDLCSLLRGIEGS